MLKTVKENPVLGSVAFAPESDDFLEALELLKTPAERGKPVFQMVFASVMALLFVCSYLFFDHSLQSVFLAVLCGLLAAVRGLMPKFADKAKSRSFAENNPQVEAEFYAGGIAVTRGEHKLEYPFADSEIAAGKTVFLLKRQADSGAQSDYIPKKLLTPELAGLLENQLS